MWSLGVIVFLLIGGYAPFDDPDLRSQYRKIKEADYKFLGEYWGHVSDEAKDFVNKLLTVDPAERNDSKKAKKHSWMKEKGKRLATQNLYASQKRLEKFNMKRRFKAAGSMVVATRRMTNISESFAADAVKAAAEVSSEVYNPDTVDGLIASNDKDGAFQACWDSPSKAMKGDSFDDDVNEDDDDDAIVFSSEFSSEKQKDGSKVANKESTSKGTKAEVKVKKQKKKSEKEANVKRGLFGSFSADKTFRKKQFEQEYELRQKVVRLVLRQWENLVVVSQVFVSS
jgi:serine/threonine protein kinase